MTTGESIARAAMALFVAALLSGCNGTSQSDESPPPPDALQSLDDLPGGIGPSDETPDAPPQPD